MTICVRSHACGSTLSVVQGFSVLHCFFQEATQMTSDSITTGFTEQKQPMYSAVELMKLPLKKRLKILACTIAEAEAIYSNDKRLTDFEAFGEDDLYDTPL